MPPHPLTNFEIQKYHQNENRFKDVHSRDKLPNETPLSAALLNATPLK